MSHTVDILLVVLAVSGAVVYLLIRKLKSARRARRDWTSGHAEACDSCPVIEIRKARERFQASSQ